MGASGTVLAGRWRLRHRIGEGGTGTVWAAEDADGSPVAVKLVHSGRPLTVALVRRFEREAEGARRVGGPHVVRILDTGVLPDGRPFLVMERLYGRDLGVVLVQEGPLVPHRLMSVLAPVVTVLADCHGAGLVHRDLKPGNVFLARDAEGGERVVLLDFGLVRSVDENDDVTGLHSVLGTPQFMAPEQARGFRVGTAADVWGLGMLVLASLTGDHYWQGGTQVERIASLLHQPMYAPTSRWTWLPEAFDGWFLRACRRDPAERFATAPEAFEALAPALAGVWASPPEGSAALTATWTDEPARIDLLPDAVASLVGRAEDEASLVRRIRATRAGTICLTGPAGVGKSALAAAVAHALVPVVAHGVVWCAAAGVHQGADLWEQLAQCLASPGVGAARERVLAALAARRLVLVLDGADALSDAASVVSVLLERCRSLCVLTTARSPLGVRDEVVQGVAPFDVAASPPDAREHPALDLLVRHAATVRPTFRLREDDVAVARSVVRRLGGNPGAIERAAHHLRAATLTELDRRLQRALSPGGDILGDLFSWTCALVGSPAVDVLLAVSAFADGFDVNGAAAVSGVAHVEGSLVALVDARFVEMIEDSQGAARFRLRADVRAAAWQRVGGTPLEDQVLERFLAWGEHRAEAIHVGLRSTDAAAWLASARRDRANLMGVRAAAEARGAWGVALRLAGALAWASYLLGDYHSGRQAVERALQEAPDDGGPARARALAGAARLALLQCDYDVAELRAARAAEDWDRLGDGDAADAAREVIGSVARERGDVEAAQRAHEAAARRAVERGDPIAAARANNLAAFAAWLGGEADRAVHLATEARRAFETASHAEGMTWSGLNLAAAAWFGRGDAAAARAILGPALGTARRARFPEGVAWCLDLLGQLDLADGQPAIAWSRLREALDVHRELGDRWRLASVVDTLARCAAAMGDCERAARLTGVAEAVRARIGVAVPRVEQPARNALLRAIVDAIGDDSTARLRAAGARGGLERAPL